MLLKDQFLLATPSLLGDYFTGALIYVCEHSDEGAMGLIVNRTAELSLPDLMDQLDLPTLAELTNVPVLDGGPVGTNQGFVLHRGVHSDTSAMPIVNDIYLSSAMDALRAIATGQGSGEFLLALGYAGWGAGQLEEELKANAWLSVPADPDVLFRTPLAERADAAAQQLGFNLSLLAPPGTA